MAWTGPSILGLPGGRVHLEIVRARQASYPGGGLDRLVFCLPDAAAREQMQARLAAAGARPVAQIDYWQANGGVTYQDPDGGSGVRILDLCPARIVMGARAWVV